MILKRTLRRPSNHEEIIEPRVHCLFNDILDSWPVNNRQHLFRHRFRSREETGSKACHREDSFADFELVHVPH